MDDEASDGRINTTNQWLCISVRNTAILQYDVRY
jgi:hypothetical protein